MRKKILSSLCGAMLLASCGSVPDVSLPASTGLTPESEASLGDVPAVLVSSTSASPAVAPPSNPANASTLLQSFPPLQTPGPTTQAIGGCTAIWATGVYEFRQFFGNTPHLMKEVTNTFRCPKATRVVSASIVLIDKSEKLISMVPAMPTLSASKELHVVARWIPSLNWITTPECVRINMRVLEPVDAPAAGSHAVDYVQKSCRTPVRLSSVAQRAIGANTATNGPNLTPQQIWSLGSTTRLEPYQFRALNDRILTVRAWGALVSGILTFPALYNDQKALSAAMAAVTIVESGLWLNAYLQQAKVMARLNDPMFAGMYSRMFVQVTSLSIGGIVAPMFYELGYRTTEDIETATRVLFDRI